MSEDLALRLAELERRLASVEDELAIHRLIVRYGLAVDVGDADQAAEVFTADGVYDVDVGRMAGREAVRAMVRGPGTRRWSATARIRSAPRSSASRSATARPRSAIRASIWRRGPGPTSIASA